MPRQTGYYRPGQAGGYASPFPAAPAMPERIHYGPLPLEQPSSRRAIEIGAPSRYRGPGGYIKQVDRMGQKIKNLQYRMLKEQLQQMKSARRRQPVRPSTGGLTPGPGAPDSAPVELARSLYKSFGGGGATPADVTRLAQVIRWMGPELTQQGLMQSGRLLGGMSAGQVGGGPSAADIAAALGGGQEDPISPSYFYPPGYVPQPTGRQSTAGAGLGLMAKGTLPGTVPKTGPAVVHKGEVVLPEEQVDAPLLRYLIEDAKRKGTLKGSPGYKCGSLPKYQRGTLGRRFGPGLGAALAGFEPSEELRDLLEQIAATNIPGWIGLGLHERLRELEPGEERRPTGEIIGRAGARTLQDIGRLVKGATEPFVRGATEALGVGPAEGPAGPTIAKGAVEGGAAGLGMGAREGPPTPTPAPVGGEPRLVDGVWTAEGPPLTEREQAYREVSGLPEQVQARHKAGMAEVQAKNLLTMLTYHRNQMNPETAKAMEKRASDWLKLADRWEGVVQRREKEAVTSIQDYQKLVRDIELAREKGEITGERQLTNIERREQLLRERYAERSEAQILRDAYQSYLGGRQREKQDALLLIANVLMRKQPRISEDRALDLAEEFVGFTPEQMEQALRLYTEEER